MKRCRAAAQRTRAVPGRGLAKLCNARESSLGLKSVLTSPSLEELGREEKPLLLEATVLTESLAS